MSQKQRLRSILDYLNERSEITVEEAVKEFNASPATIRRDFNILTTEGKVEKTWGGIMSITHDPRNGSMVPLSFRQTQYAAEKKKIAEQAASLVQDGDVIIIDGGTTTLFMAHYLANKRIRVITNSILIAYQIDQERMSKSGPEVFLTGGILYPESGLLVGPQTNANIKQYHAKLAFLSVAAINAKEATNSNQLVVETEKTIMEQSDTIVFLADQSKFGKKNMCKMCDIEQIDILLTNKTEENTDILNEIRGKGVEVVEV